jgi:AAA domain/TrwC relaxase
MPNVTWDEAEQRFKAAELGQLFMSKAYHDAVFHARLNEELMAAGYGFRRTDKGLEMSVFQPKETRVFCKRTAETEKLEEKESADLHRKTEAKVKAAAARGEVLDYEYEYGKLKDKLGERTRKGKDTAVVEGQALEQEWAKQLEPGRWEAITPEAARNGDRIDFLDAETAKSMAIQHAFEQKSVIRDAYLFKAIAQFGCGTMSVAKMKLFCQEDARLVRNPDKPGMVTTRAIMAEEQEIRELVISGKGIRQPPITKGEEPIAGEGIRQPPITKGEQPVIVDLPGPGRRREDPVSKFLDGWILSMEKRQFRREVARLLRDFDYRKLVEMYTQQSSREVLYALLIAGQNRIDEIEGKSGLNALSAIVFGIENEEAKQIRSLMEELVRDARREWGREKREWEREIANALANYEAWAAREDAKGRVARKQPVSKSVPFVQQLLARLAPGSAVPTGSAWKPHDKQLDAGQLAAVKLILENRDLAVAVPGYTGAGKSRTVKEAALAVKTLTGLEPVILAPGGRAAGKLAEAAGASESYTLAKFRESEKLQLDAKGRQIFIDEFSHINNEDARWILQFARANGNQIVFWGDGAQYLGVSRGDPVSDLLKAGLLNYAQLTEIYRQKENPELLSAVLAAAENRYQESVDQVKAAGWMHVEDNEDKLRGAIVDAMAEKLARDEPVMAIALQHKHGEAISREVRARLKEAGYLGKEDHQVKWLKGVHLSEAQRGDAINFEAGQTVKFHRLSAGGFKSGEAWTVASVEDARVIVRKDGQEKALPLSNAKDFQVYESGVMELSAGDRLLMTRNNAKANVRTGDIRKITRIDARSITLDNGKTLDITEGLHARQGYTVTGLVSQGDQATACYAFFPASAAGQINQRTWLVSISRAQTELRVFTDCPELLEQRAVMPEDRDSALSLVHGSPPAPTVEQSPAVDLQEGKRPAPRQTTEEIIAAMEKCAATVTLEQQQKAAEFERQWQQTHGQAQERGRGMQR